MHLSTFALIFISILFLSNDSMIEAKKPCTRSRNRNGKGGNDTSIETSANPISLINVSDESSTPSDPTGVGSVESSNPPSAGSTIGQSSTGSTVGGSAGTNPGSTTSSIPNTSSGSVVTSGNGVSSSSSPMSSGTTSNTGSTVATSSGSSVTDSDPSAEGSLISSQSEGDSDEDDYPWCDEVTGPTIEVIADNGDSSIPYCDEIDDSTGEVISSTSGAVSSPAASAPASTGGAGSTPATSSSTVQSNTGTTGSSAASPGSQAGSAAASSPQSGAVGSSPAASSPAGSSPAASSPAASSPAASSPAASSPAASSPAASAPAASAPAASSPASPTGSSGGTSPAGWKQTNKWTGDDFLGSDWEFFSAADPTHGSVIYQTKEDAVSKGLAFTKDGIWYMKADSTTQGDRPSVRINTVGTFTLGLFVLDVAHVPVGTGVWPAFWTFGPNWPNSGEIDIFEGVSSSTANAVTLHTKAGCTMNGSSCEGNQGCSIPGTNAASYGDGLNAVGGGVFAMKWTNDAIQVWFFARADIPANLSSGSPDESTWGTAVATFANGNDCNIADNFMNHQIIFDITFCGDWAGAVISNCATTVQNNPGDYANAYFAVNSVAVYAQA